MTFSGIDKSLPFMGYHFWARGYWVWTVGHDEQAVKEYIRYQEAEDRRLDQPALFAEMKERNDE